MLNRLRTMEYAVKNSGWLMLDSVDTLFENGKKRIYNEKHGNFIIYRVYNKKKDLCYLSHNLIKICILFIYRIEARTKSKMECFNRSIT